MKKKIIGILICMLLLSMTFSVATAQKMIKDEDQVINVLDNTPPTDPIITCPDVVRKNFPFLVRAVSTDPENDQIYYRIVVGDDGVPSQWIGPRDSGVEFATGMGIFQYTGDIVIGFQAKDEHDAESGWSYHTVHDRLFVILVGMRNDVHGNRDETVVVKLGKRRRSYWVALG